MFATKVVWQNSFGNKYKYVFIDRERKKKRERERITLSRMLNENNTKS
jgi:hypothetical protein